MQFIDKVHAKNIRRTSDGYLVATAPVARAGVQLYRGAELGQPDRQFVRVLRPESEVFSQDSMRSYAHRPMTNDHPGDLVTADNWKQHAIGQTGDEVIRDGSEVRVPLVMMDGAAIAAYEDGKRELSMGYTAEVNFLDETATTEDGLEYDAIQTDLKMNHLALVDKGRAGVAKIGDGGRAPVFNELPEIEGGLSMPDPIRTVIVDGLSVQTTEQGEQAINKLQAALTDSQQALTDAESVHDTAIAAKDAELAKRDTEIEKLKGATLTDEQIDARVAARADLVAQAKALHDADYSGKSDLEIKTAVVAARFGDEAVTDKSQAYIDARYDVLVEDSAAKQGDDPVRAALSDSQTGAPGDVAAKAHAELVNDLRGAYRTPAAQ